MSKAPGTRSEAPGTRSEAPGTRSEALDNWSDSLDSLAALVERQRRHLAGEAAAPLDEWIPPASPLPDSLLPRAILLHHETLDMAAQIQRRVSAAPDARVSPYT
jgi:hypothetical protein